MSETERHVAEQKVPKEVIDAFHRRYGSYLRLEPDDHEWRNTWRFKHDHIQSRWEGWRDSWLDQQKRSPNPYPITTEREDA